MTLTLRSRTTLDAAEQPDFDRAASNKLFRLFCLSGFLLAAAYGTTFLLGLLVASRGGHEGDTGLVIAAATLTTVAAVLASGHLSDAVGAIPTAAGAGLLLGLACFGFAVTPNLGFGMIACGALLGAGWGIFYTLGPIIVSGFIAPEQRMHRFALLSGSMMSGIGTGPLLGRLVAHFGLPLESAFYLASAASVTGGLTLVAIRCAITRATAAQSVVQEHRLTLASALLVCRADARWPILMVGLGGAIFGGLSSFQTSYAASRGLDYSLFFLGFMTAAVICRLALSGVVTRADPYRASAALSALMVASLAMFQFWVEGWLTYLVAAAILGSRYGLTYSVINGLAAKEAPVAAGAQTLVLFSLSYFLGVFGFAAIAGWLVAGFGIAVLLWTTLAVAIVNCGVAVGRLVARASPAI